MIDGTSSSPVHYDSYAETTSGATVETYANAGPDTNGSQFFITEKAFVGEQAQQLNGNYTIFGQCDAASVILEKQIARMARDPGNDRPFRPVKINHITVVPGTITVAKPATAAKPIVRKTPATAPKATSPK